MTRVALSADRIVTTAETLIRSSGSTEWTVRALCKELECAPGAIYRYFPGGVDAIGADRFRECGVGSPCDGVPVRDELAQALRYFVFRGVGRVGVY